MPLQRRVPKRGFNSRLARQTVNARLTDLQKLPEGEEATVAALRKLGVAPHGARRVKVFLSGKISRPVTLRGVAATAGARAAIEAAGGKAEPPAAGWRKPAGKRGKAAGAPRQ